VRFWDSSAIVPLFVAEPLTPVLLPLAAESEPMAVWWGSSVEVVAAMARKERAGQLPVTRFAEMLSAFRNVARSWREVAPSASIRMRAERLLRVHPLRAADSLQLAAALAIVDGSVSSVEFVCLDERLSHAATLEGFRVVPVPGQE
jgi:predicted nucleic acid-binding protein